jgi:hypothetical protein
MKKEIDRKREIYTETGRKTGCELRKKRESVKDRQREREIQRLRERQDVS